MNLKIKNNSSYTYWLTIIVLINCFKRLTYLQNWRILRWSCRFVWWSYRWRSRRFQLVLFRRWFPYLLIFDAGIFPYCCLCVMVDKITKIKRKFSCIYIEITYECMVLLCASSRIEFGVPAWREGSKLRTFIRIFRWHNDNVFSFNFCYYSAKVLLLHVQQELMFREFLISCSKINTHLRRQFGSVAPKMFRLFSMCSFCW